MSTEINAPLAIPEADAQGFGSYTIPANFYGHLVACAASTSGPYMQSANTATTFTLQGSGGASSAATTSNNSQWVRAGQSITVQSSVKSYSTSRTSIGGIQANTYNSFYRIYLDGVDFVSAWSNAQIHSYNYSQFINMGVISGGTYGWHVALFRIPKNNLPTGLAEGE